MVSVGTDMDLSSGQAAGDLPEGGDGIPHIDLPHNAKRRHDEKDDGRQQDERDPQQEQRKPETKATPVRFFNVHVGDVGCHGCSFPCGCKPRYLSSCSKRMASSAVISPWLSRS